MQASTFVSRLQKIVGEATIADVLSQLRRPAGRKPAPEVAARSDWFNGLSPADKLQIEAVIAETVRATLFGVLCALDGSRSIIEQDEGEALELRYRDVERDTLLASTSPESHLVPLHELL